MDRWKSASKPSNKSFSVKNQTESSKTMKTEFRFRLVRGAPLLLLLAIFTAFYAAQLSTAHAQGTAFTYQGRLNNGGVPANGIYDLQFTIYDLATNGTLLAGPITNSTTGVSNGLFTVLLDFGATPFTGADRWLDIAVRTNGGGAFTTLNPRQKLTPSPYAITAGNLAGVIANNSVPGVDATIGGGDQNTASGSRSTVSGGETNTASGSYSTVAGGLQNSASGGGSAVSGGLYNIAGGILATVGGGDGNRASGLNSTVGGGDINQATGDYSTIPGGENNFATGQYSFAAGQRAQAGHQGAFVWADSQTATFASTANDQFSIRAQGGVRLATSGAGITLDGQPLLSGSSSLNANNLSSGTVPDARLSANVALLGNNNVFFGDQTFNGAILLNSESGFDQSSAGNFYIDAPFWPGGRFTVLENGHVGIADSNPLHTLEVNGDSEFAGDATFDGALNLTATAPTIYSGGNLLLRSDGSLNFFAGKGAGNLGVSGSQNTGVGYSALNNNSSGAGNTANGLFALLHNTIGNFNTAVGGQALDFNTSGSDNTAAGTGALYSNTNGNFNTAVGYTALYNNTNASQNIALGYQAGYNITTGSGNICIGNPGTATDANTIRIGTTQTRAFMAGIESVAVPLGTPVYVGTNNQLGITVSSARFKQNIQYMAGTSDGLLSLRPVTFQYRPEIDPQGTPQFGLVAEEVAKVNPDLVLHDGQGRPLTVRYDAVNAMLLNEFLKQHRTVNAQNSEIQELKQQNDSLKKRLDNLEQMVKSLIAKD
jgi:Chaperone of endosialidase